jgi:hypothetical protein
MYAALFKSDIGKVVSVAQAPVSLVIATSIFLHMLTSRYVPMYDRLRALTDEYRRNPEKDSRRSSIRQQISVYDKRIKALQKASMWLNWAVVCFLGTVGASGASIVYPEVTVLPLAGIATMAGGLLLILGAVGCELYENRLSSLALRTELFEFPEFSDDQTKRASPNRTANNPQNETHYSA